MMGSPDSEAGRDGNEGPQHQVTISSGFWMAETACTQALYEAVRGENPSYFMGSGRPVEEVSWEDAQRFLAVINERLPGLGLRLPSEAEWEYACRAGIEQATYAGDLTLDDGWLAPELEAIAWYTATRIAGPKP